MRMSQDEEEDEFSLITQVSKLLVVPDSRIDLPVTSHDCPPLSSSVLECHVQGTLMLVSFACSVLESLRVSTIRNLDVRMSGSGLRDPRQIPHSSPARTSPGRRSRVGRVLSPPDEPGQSETCFSRNPEFHGKLLDCY